MSRRPSTAADRAPHGHLTAEDLRRLIEQYGPTGFDLSCANLDGENLDGMNLAGVRFGDRDLCRGASMVRCSLLSAILDDASLPYVNLSDARMRHVRLPRAQLVCATLAGADLRDANLADADLYKADLRGALLDDANLAQANLYLAKLSNTRFGRDELHLPLLEDVPEKYEALIGGLESQGHHFDRPNERLRRLRANYEALRNNWRDTSRGLDAAWARIAERRVERAMRAPGRAAAFFPTPSGDYSGPRKAAAWAAFHVKHTASWLLSGFIDLTCGYGESPLRAFLTMLAVVLLFWPLYALSGGIAQNTYFSPFAFLIYSVVAFMSLGTQYLKATNWQAEALTAVEALLGMTLFALLIFTLSNRTNRM